MSKHCLKLGVLLIQPMTAPQNRLFPDLEIIERLILMWSSLRVPNHSVILGFP
ncbi:hypothetical protein [Dulcicalothrix desertica]|uniref:hypothetical protein n=1 Tax=Dulcicalothrix desertica TaxID=32056 RepID=UPI0013156904|nr:hypothetical protein [Dulcicalothrix desertica]